MEKPKSSENDRAYRIAFRMNELHDHITDLYENLVDRDFVSADGNVRSVMIELRYILTEIEEDDF
jgi:hypothetical protein